jgi:UDP-N-acetylmuramate dehydrogenase
LEKARLYQLFRDKEFGKILFDEPMKNHTSFKIGGPADVLIIPEKEEEIVDAIRFCREHQIKHFIMGNGTNLLVKDSGIRGVVIKVANGFDRIDVVGEKVICQSGALLSKVAKYALKHSLTGFEFASGIPGTIGGAIAMNAGAYGGEMKDVVSKVKALDRNNNIVELTNEEMNFRYRGSLVSDENLVVLGVELNLKKGDYSSIEAKMEDLTDRRVSKQPLEYPSAGSTFKRPEGYFAGKLIEDAGLRGVRYGDAQVSEKHCGFVINVGEATFDHVITLIRMIQKVVYDKFNVKLEPEVKIIGDD